MNFQEKNFNSIEKIKTVSKNIVMGLIFSGFFSCNDAENAASGPLTDSIGDTKEHVNIQSLSDMFDSTRMSAFGENFTLNNKKELITEIEKQKKWILSYIGSPMYLERLTAELVRSGLTQDIAQVKAGWIIEERKNNILNGRYAIRNKLDPRGQCWIMGITTPKEDWTINLKTGERLKYMPGQYSPTKGNMFFESSLYDNKDKEGYETIPVHEMTHQSTDGDVGIINNTKMELDTLAKTDFTACFKDEESGVTFFYLDDPTEVMARVNVLRYLLSRYHIYDAGTEVFTEKHIDELLKVKEIHEDSGVEDLMKYIIKNKQGLVWVMNNVATIDEIISDTVKNTT